MIGVIYGLFCKDDDQLYEFYIGSTWDAKQREQCHNSRCNNPNDPKSQLKVYQYIRDHNGWDNWEFIVLDEVEVESEHELRQIEGQYQLEYGATLGGKIAGRTKPEYNKEYHEKNKEKIAQHKKEHYETNKEKKKEKFTCICGSDYTQSHKARHEKTQKHQDYLKSKDLHAS